MEDFESDFPNAEYDPERTDTRDECKPFVWCLHCERAYPYGFFRVGDNGLHYCPYDNCDGDAFMDAWPWSKVAKQNGYAVQPEIGKTYPMYGK